MNEIAILALFAVAIRTQSRHQKKLERVGATGQLDERIEVFGDAKFWLATSFNKMLAALATRAGNRRSWSPRRP